MGRVTDEDKEQRFKRIKELQQGVSRVILFIFLRDLGVIKEPELIKNLFPDI